MLLLSALPVAFADIPPPLGTVETCTVANHQRDGRVCVPCEGWHGGREPCEALEAKGYAQVCRTSGASVWTEVMCTGVATAGGDPPPKDSPATDAPAVDTPVRPAPEAPASRPSTPPAEPAPSRCDTGGMGWGALWLATLPWVRRRAP